MSENKDVVNFFLKRQDKHYYFLKVLQNKDGTLECIFPHLAPSQKKITQKLQLSQDAITGRFTTRIIDEQPITNLKDEITYISYHTSGQVNYHRMSFSPIHLEPLFNITQINPFFILTFQELCCFQRVTEKELQKSKGKHIICDISSMIDNRLDMILSIAPLESQFEESHSVILSVNYAPLFRLMIEFVNDKDTFCFADQYEPSDCAKIQIHNGLFSEPQFTKGQACLKYLQKIYSHEDIIILSPNAEGIINLFFSVEMRRRPFVKIDFVNSSQKIHIISKETYCLKFKVFDERKNAYVKKAEEIQIKGITLDAEIYDNEETPPDGWL